MWLWCKYESNMEVIQLMMVTVIFNVQFTEVVNNFIVSTLYQGYFLMKELVLLFASGFWHFVFCLREDVQRAHVQGGMGQRSSCLHASWPFWRATDQRGTICTDNPFYWANDMLQPMCVLSVSVWANGCYDYKLSDYGVVLDQWCLWQFELSQLPHTASFLEASCSWS